jgi:phosphonate transport system permease protein
MFEGRRALTFVLLGAFIWSLLNIEWSDGVLHAGGLAAAGEIGGSLFRPELSLDVLGDIVEGAGRTVAYAVTGLSLALVIGFPLGVIASGVLNGPKGGGRWSMVGSVRFALAAFRSVHELVWAWLFVAAVGLSPIAAVLALAIPYSGILGRIYAELFQDVPEAPLTALRSAGASEWRVFWYGRLPMVMSELLGYTFYRLECGIRSATVLSFVGLGGLGFKIQTALDDLDYARAWTFILAVVVMILVVDWWSSVVRRRVQG